VYKGVAENTVRTINDTLMKLCTWHMCDRWYTDLTYNLYHHGIKAGIPVWKKCMFSVYSQEVTICFSFTSVPNCLACRAFN